MHIRILGFFFFFKDLDLKVNTDAVRMAFDQCLCVVSDPDLRSSCSLHAGPLIRELRCI